jgi:hypothetical protein
LRISSVPREQGATPIGRRDLPQRSLPTKV